MPKSFYRRGPDHRAGAPVTFLDVRRRFQFRSVEIGRWVTEPEKQRSAALFYDALCDLMTILGGTESLISLRGSLALQYGIGGRPGVSAHYTPATRSFALAKNAGPGSIAHEWFHAFDHYIADKLFPDTRKGDFGSSLWLKRENGIVHPLNDKLQACYRAILLDQSGSRPSELFRCSAQADKAAGIHYFSRPEELCARAFEAFVQDAECKNGFLVKGTKESEEARLGLYPQGEQRRSINQAFLDYYHHLGRALRRAL
ncbi:calcium-activated chloride channel protein [Marinobacter salinexigens]|uniref:Calcium-activated chloride channel protein n=1 Tax=Marinobacter salinexigens TaxID=2919747 RepID=A0A5B0VDU7_9GAMM|nr:CLCA_X family protein [Marinobacter salinexigens]KAA1172880.1 calcium-activated chloride channel protein [Marinobacter salinexigens]